jgi:hypothetical protein
MSDHLPPTPVVTRDYCPTCEPTVDPVRELVTVFYCGAHAPILLGGADDQVRQSLRSTAVFSCGDETGGVAYQEFCDSIHRPTEATCPP